LDTTRYHHNFTVPARQGYLSPTKLMCSEGVVRFLQFGQYEFATGLNPEATSPGELLDLVANKGLSRLAEPTELRNPKETSSWQ